MQYNIEGTVQFQRRVNDIWVGVSLEAKTDLHLFWRGSINAQTYIMNILEEFVFLLAPSIGNHFQYMHGNA